MGTVLERVERDAGASTPTSSSWVERHATPLALGLCAAYLALLLPHLGAQSIWFDEAVTLSNAQQPFDVARYMAADATPPLYPLLVHLWMRVFGVTLESARALSVLASAASLVALFQLGRRFFDARAGLAAALLLACSRCQLFFAFEARAYAVVVLLCIVSFHVLLALLERPTRGRVLLLALVDALLLYAHYVAVFALAAQGVAAVLAARRSRAPLVAFAASQAVVALLVLPLVLYVASLWPLPMAGWLAAPTWRSFPTELAKLVGSDLLLALDSVLVLGGAAWIARRSDAGRLDWTRFWILMAWALVPPVAAFAASLVVPMFLGRYLVYVAPGIFLLIGAVVAWLPVRGGTRATIVGLLCLLSLVHAYRVPLVRPAWRDAALEVRDTLHRDGLVVVVPAHQLLPFAYHFSRRDFAEPARLRDLLAAERVVGVAHLDDAATFAATGRELAVVLPEALAAGSDALAARLAAQGYAAGARGAVPGLVLLRYRPAPAAGAS